MAEKLDKMIDSKYRSSITTQEYGKKPMIDGVRVVNLNIMGAPESKTA